MHTVRNESSEDPGDALAQYLSPRDLAIRWSCSRTSAQRIAERAGFARYLLGQGRNGMVRYALAEIEAFERRNRFGAPGTARR